MKWAWRVLLAAGLAALAYCGFAVIDGWMYQTREAGRLDDILLARQRSPAAMPELPATMEKGLFGRMEITRLGLSVMVSEGVDRLTLRRAAGHIPGTGLPGQPGNVGISAHRDTFFRPLKDIRTDDIITLTTVRAAYRYRVVSTQVVPPSDVAVLAPGDDQVLTLVTCYPFYFVGAAPDRFIVRAERII
jgi:sortase A